MKNSYPNLTHQFLGLSVQKIDFLPSTSSRFLRVYQALPRAIAAFACLNLFTAAAHADGWKFNTKDSTKYFDAKEKRPVHLLLRSDSHQNCSSAHATNGQTQELAIQVSRPRAAHSYAD